MRRLVVLSDGTWNEPSDDSNVAKLWRAIAERDDQLCFYDPGVGLQSQRAARQGRLKNLFDRVGGGAFGAGLSGNVQEAYRWIVETYEPGDQLWFFGFSRGAFTVRSTIGFIRKIGLLPRPFDDQLVRRAYDLYRKRDAKPDTDEVARFRSEHNARAVGELDLAFVGVWDTVGSLGVPGLVLGPISRRRWGFHDHRLSSHVRHAYQALAIDELRAAFLAALWTGEAAPPQQVEQRWFAGAHGDIGGRVADHSLIWVAGMAQRAGLEFREPVESWPQPRSAPVRERELASRFWRIAGGQALRPIGSAAGERLDDSVAQLRREHQEWAPDNLAAFSAGAPLNRPRGKRWWYTLPGSNSYFIDQYDQPS